MKVRRYRPDKVKVAKVPTETAPETGFDVLARGMRQVVADGDPFGVRRVKTVSLPDFSGPARTVSLDQDFAMPGQHHLYPRLRFPAP